MDNITKVKPKNWNTINNALKPAGFMLCKSSNDNGMKTEIVFRNIITKKVYIFVDIVSNALVIGDILDINILLEKMKMSVDFENKLTGLDDITQVEIENTEAITLIYHSLKTNIRRNKIEGILKDLEEL